MDIDDLLAEMDAPEPRRALPSGINPWDRVLYDVNAPNPRKVEGGKRAQRTTRERHGRYIADCENPDCDKQFNVAIWKKNMTFACSQNCRDKMGRLRRAGKVPLRALSANVVHEPWKHTTSWKSSHPTEES